MTVEFVRDMAALGYTNLTLDNLIRIRDHGVTPAYAKALKAPWRVTKRYRKQPPGTWAWDYACAENNRNPVSSTGKTLTLGPDGKPIDKVVD